MKAQVKNFSYNGFSGTLLPGFAKYKVMALDKWTNDPGIGSFLCSDKKIRLIPSFALSKRFLNTVKKPPNLNPFKGIGTFFGKSCKS